MTPGDLMDTADVAALLGVTPETLRVGRSSRARYEGMPEPVKLVGQKYPVWDRAAIEAWASTLEDRRQ